MKKSKQDMGVMLVFMILSAIVYLVFIPSQIKLSSDTGFTNRTFPQFTMVVIFLASAAGFLEAFSRYRKSKKDQVPEEDAKKPSLRSSLLPLLGFLVILVYALIFHFASIQWRGYGLIIATVIFIPAFLLLVRCKNWRHYVAAYSFAAVMYLVFRFILHVALR